MTIELIRTLIRDNPRTFEGYSQPVRDAVGRYAQLRREEGICWDELGREVGISSTSMRSWMRALPAAGFFHQVAVIDDRSPGEVVADPRLVITSPSGFTLTGCTLDQAAAVLQSLR